MADTTLTETTKFKKGTRVVATTDLRGVAEGTSGSIRIAVGLTWLRYRVSFDNGADVGSVGHEKLVPEADWPHFKENRTKLEAEAAEAAKERAAAAKAAPPPAAADAGDGNDRLAAMLARSKAAKAAKQG